MNDKDDKVFERLAIVAAVISFAITVALLIAAGSPRKGGKLLIVLYFIIFIAVCVTYFLGKGIYKALKWSYARYSIAFRLMVVIAGLTSIPVGIDHGISMVARDAAWRILDIFLLTNPTLIFFMFFTAGMLSTFIPVFTIGQVLYLTFKWVGGGKKMSQFYFRITTIFSIVSAGIAAFISSLDTSRIAYTYYEYGNRKKQTIGEFVDEYGLLRAIDEVDINLSTSAGIVGALCFACVWLIYFSILWVYRARPNENKE